MFTDNKAYADFSFFLCLMYEGRIIIVWWLNSFSALSFVWSDYK